jgi:SAM-dependent methyltransferase
MRSTKIDTRAIGLDVGLQFVRWLTGAENLHYGLWDGLEVTAANLRAAQEAYTEKLFALLPEGPLRVLDIGGGAGETAKKLISLGHDVEIVVPSPLLAQRCRENAPAAVVHECRFEDFEGSGDFDLCLFSESYQYVALSEGVPRCLRLLKPGGHIVISDCFRSEDFAIVPGTATVGGGHLIGAFRESLASWPVTLLSEEDITASVAPSVEIEQGLYNVLGYALNRVSDELAAKRPMARWSLERLVRLVMNDRKRSRLDQRLNQQTRNRGVFAQNNTYLMMLLRKQD